MGDRRLPRGQTLTRGKRRLALQFLMNSITPMGHPPRIPVWLKCDQPVIYFLTFGVANRQKVLANDIAFAASRAQSPA